MCAVTYRKAAGVALVADQEGKKSFPQRVSRATSDPKTSVAALLYEGGEETWLVHVPDKSPSVLQRMEARRLHSIKAKGGLGSTVKDPHLTTKATYWVPAQLRDLTASVQEITRDACVHNQ